MSDPINAVKGTLVPLGTVTLTGTFLGLHYDAILFGFLAALLSLVMIVPDDPARTETRVYMKVIAATFFAAVLAPSGVALAAQYAPQAYSTVGPDYIRILSAAVIGFLANSVVPLLVKRLKDKIGGAK